MNPIAEIAFHKHVSWLLRLELKKKSNILSYAQVFICFITHGMTKTAKTGIIARELIHFMRRELRK